MSQKIDWTTFGEIETFLPTETSINNFTYTVPATYKLAWAYIYVDANNISADWNIFLNELTVGVTIKSTRSTISMMVKGGDTIRVSLRSGTGSPYHLGRIRKIF